MEIGVKVLYIAESTRTREVCRILLVYFTFVAVNKNRKPVEIQKLPLLLKKVERYRCYEETEHRRHHRKVETEEQLN